MEREDDGEGEKMSEWIKCSERMPLLNHPVLVYAKAGALTNGEPDLRKLKMYLGYFERVFFLPNPLFTCDCDCKGWEHKRESIEPVYWRELPEAPNE